MKTAEHSEAFAAGQKHAELFFAFSHFLYETCQQRGLSDLFFCTREGVFFKAVFDALFCRPGNNSTVRTHLLEASRLSVFPATVLKNGQLDISGLFRLYKLQSANTILKSLGRNIGTYQELFTEYGIQADKLMAEAECMKALKGLLHDPRFIANSYPELERKRQSTLGYLRQELGNLRDIGFVDIGWRGTIQNCIATLLPERNFVGMYMGLAPERNIMQPNCEKVAYGPNQNISREHIDLLHAVNVLEFVCLSTGGSASGYVEKEAGQYRADMQIDVQENASIAAFSIHFQQGVLSEAHNINLQTLLASHQTGELRRKAMQQWRHLIRKPPQALVDAYFALRSNEAFGLGSMADQSMVPSTLDVLLALFSSSKRDKLIRFLTYNQWATGMLLRSDLTTATELMLFLLLKFAESYKKIRNYVR